MHRAEIDPITGHPKKKTVLDEYGNPIVLKTPFQQFVDTCKGVAATPAFQIGTAVPTVIFLITIVLWTYGWMSYWALCVVWSLLILCLCFGLISYHESSGAGFLIMPVCIGALIAVTAGSFLGLYLYDSYAIFPIFYGNSRTYTNVVASESSTAVLDAGKLKFNSLSYVQTKKGAGIVTETGKKYCVAPVMHKQEVKRVEFWAAGLECCEPLGEFRCDNSQDKDANGGVVVFDNNGWFFPARFQFYEKARGKAEAEYGLQSVARPMYVRWVTTDKLDFLQSSYARMAKLWIVFLTICFGLLFALLSFSMWQNTAVMF
mmetsp:Transcript_24456/g.42796  ORF Transcript_24456/g.42796 Transcript_24456/m.42796 type:complete len:317 (-) Transcript_24456:52-1002(-)